MSSFVHLASKTPLRIARAFALKRAEARLVLPAVLQRPGRVDPNVVVSLTTFPARISHVGATLESIFRQSVAPAAVVLVLSNDEFNDRRLPAQIEVFRERGLRVMFQAGNRRSYKKLIPVLEKYSDRVIVTADDDVIYPREWLAELLSAHNERPSSVLGHRGTLITSIESRVDPYLKWPRAVRNSPSPRVFLTGMGGILYPPGSMPSQVLDMNLATKLCPTADDIWFKAMALLAGTHTAKINDGSGDFPSLPSGRLSALNETNVAELRNDSQFAAVMDHFRLWDALN